MRKTRKADVGPYSRASAALWTDRLDEAKATFDEAVTRKFDARPMHVTRALLAFLQKDKPAMQEQWSWAVGNVGKPAAESTLLYDASLAAVGKPPR